MLDLGAPELVADYAPPPSHGAWQRFGGAAAWCASHPQQLTPPSHALASLLEGVLDWSAYSPAAGFVGFGANLLVANASQLQVQVPVRGVLAGARAARTRERSTTPRPLDTTRACPRLCHDARLLTPSAAATGGRLKYDRGTAPVWLGLRQSLYQQLLGTCLLFESRKAMMECADALHAANRVLPGCAARGQ